jgi:hypothetical protein
MTTVTEELTLIIQQPTAKNIRKHYTKAHIINSSLLDEKLEDIMDQELLYGYSEYYQA